MGTLIEPLSYRIFGEGTPITTAKLVDLQRNIFTDDFLGWKRLKVVKRAAVRVWNFNSVRV